jgi:hypothetical protein
VFADETTHLADDDIVRDIAGRHGTINLSKQ